MKVGYLITARLKSTRLPRKLLLKTNGREMIRHMIDRLKTSRRLDHIIICTSINSQDDALELIAKEEGVDIFRGSEEDVLVRLNGAALEFNLDYVLNITADCPLVSISYIDKILENYTSTNADFVRCLDLPHGFFSYGIKDSALAKVCEIKKEGNTEVWGRYFTDTGLFHVEDLKIPESLIRPDYRLTLDYQEDFEFFKSLFDHFGDSIIHQDVESIVNFLDENPEIVKINQHCGQAYLKRWESQNKIELK